MNVPPSLMVQAVRRSNGREIWFPSQPRGAKVEPNETSLETRQNYVEQLVVSAIGVCICSTGRNLPELLPTH